jgi:hypothetical protein
MPALIERLKDRCFTGGAAAQAEGRIRVRSVVVGLVLSALICALTPYNNVYRNGTLLGGGHFPLAPFFVLFWITVLTAAIGSVLNKIRLMTGKELLFTWIMMVLASGIAYTGLVRTFFVNLTAPYHFATVGNRFEELLHPLLPKLLYPQSGDAIQKLYDGLDGGRDMPWADVIAQIPWHVWLTPLLSWGLFIFLCYTVMVSVVNLFSRQWILNERMNFPLLQVPMMMEESVERGGLWRYLTDRYLLVGLLVPVALHTINGLHFYFPSFPALPTQILAGAYFPKYGLFSAFHHLEIYFYPAFIGFAFLAPRQISFSFWFFFFAGGLLIGLLSVMGYNIPAAALGVTFGPHLTRPEETQMIGAYGVFFLFILWLARQHLVNVMGQAFGIKPGNRSETEWFSVRLSFWVCVAASVALIAWFRFFGLPVMAGILLVGAFFLVSLVASRVICQGGVAYFTLTAAPMDGLLAFFGPGLFAKTGLVVSAVAQKVLFLDYRESLMPSLFHAGKVTQGMRNKRMVFIGIVLTLTVAVVVSFVAMLALCYKFGVREIGLDWATRTSLTVTENVRTLVETPKAPGYWVRAFSVIGAVVMLGLVIGYHRFTWWPLHPVGYLMAYSMAMKVLWFSFLVGWAANAVVMRYGGVALFKRLRFLFMGLIIGDFLMGGLWAVVGLFTDFNYLVLPD